MENDQLAKDLAELEMIQVSVHTLRKAMQINIFLTVILWSIAGIFLGISDYSFDNDHLLTATSLIITALIMLTFACGVFYFWWKDTGKEKKMMAVWNEKYKKLYGYEFIALTKKDGA